MKHLTRHAAVFTLGAATLAGCELDAPRARPALSSSMSTDPTNSTDSTKLDSIYVARRETGCLLSIEFIRTIQPHVGEAAGETVHAGDTMRVDYCTQNYERSAQTDDGTNLGRVEAGSFSALDEKSGPLATLEKLVIMDCTPVPFAAYGPIR